MEFSEIFNVEVLYNSNHIGQEMKNFLSEFGEKKRSFSNPKKIVKTFFCFSFLSTTTTVVVVAKKPDKRFMAAAEKDFLDSLAR
jgi:hypothetical protein